MDKSNSAIANSNNDQPDTHRSSSPTARENLNSDKGNSAPVNTRCTPAATRPKRAQTGLYVKAKTGLILRDRRVRRMAAKVRAVMPWLQASDQPALRAWCEMEILCEQAFAALRAFGILKRDGDARRLFHDYRQMRATQAVYANALGLTPEQRLALKANSKGLPFDVEATPVVAEPTPEERQAYAKQVLACLIECKVIQLPEGIRLPEGVVTPAPSDATA